MGAGSSSGQLGPEELKLEADRLTASTQPTRDVMDLLFAFLRRDLKIKDFYRLTSPEESNKYVAFLGSRLEPLFYDLKVVPAKGSNGTIYFQKLDLC